MIQLTPFQITNQSRGAKVFDDSLEHHEENKESSEYESGDYQDENEEENLESQEEVDNEFDELGDDGGIVLEGSNVSLDPSSESSIGDKDKTPLPIKPHPTKRKYSHAKPPSPPSKKPAFD